MGRLADFAAKDLRRKRLAMKANGGQWRPPPEYMHMQAQAAQMPGSQNFPQIPPKQALMPAFSGMVPGVREAQLPMGFEATRDASPQSTQSDEMDIQARTQEAEEEWQEIRNAFSVLEDYFGEDFQALGPEFSEPMDTPFGPALKYRTYGIAGIWMNFYMGLIACHRAHPSMPPAAMVAAGIAARQTASFANEIGRIAAGIAPDCSITTQVNPTVGAALIESSTCLFVSGVQVSILQLVKRPPLTTFSIKTQPSVNGQFVDFVISVVSRDGRQHMLLRLAVKHHGSRLPSWAKAHHTLGPARKESFLISGLAQGELIEHFRG
jgi:hypothetical protein